MSLNSMNDDERIKFNDPAQREAMKETLADNPIDDDQLKTLSQLKNVQRKRRESVSYTLNPEVKVGIAKLAKDNGFNSTSQYVEMVFKSILGQNDKQ